MVRQEVPELYDDIRTEYDVAVEIRRIDAVEELSASSTRCEHVEGIGSVSVYGHDLRDFALPRQQHRGDCGVLGAKPHA